MSDGYGADIDARVLLVHRFYAPDVTTYSQMLAKIANQLRQDGLKVSVFTSQPSYNKAYDGPACPKRAFEDGVEVLRKSVPGGGSSLGRLLGGVLFGFLLLAHAVARRGKYDVIMVSTVPPVLMGLFGAGASKLAGARLVYHCMDLYPEIAVASGQMRLEPLRRIAQRLDSFTVNRASRTVVLSQDMLRTIEERGSSTSSVHVQNNFTIGDHKSASAEVDLPTSLKRSSRFRLIFAGNLGRFQGLDALVDGFAESLSGGQDSEVELVFLGSGAARSATEAQVSSLGLMGNVSFVDHQPLPVAMQAMVEADLAVVSLGPQLIRSAYPSKLVMYLEMGCRVLAVVEPDSELAALVLDNDLGSVASPGAKHAISKAIDRERQRLWSEDDSARARAIAEREFSAERILPRWTEIISTELVSTEMISTASEKA